MKILLYDWALDFLGGGQKYCCDMAAALGKEHDVTLLCRKPVERSFLAGAYGLDLGRVNFINLKFRPRFQSVPLGLYNLLLQQWNLAAEAAEISPLTAKYDLFINCESTRAMIEPLSPKSVLVCHFPPRGDLRREWEAYGPVLKYTYALPYRALAGRFTPQNYAERYGAVITSSEFARCWLKELWGLPAGVLYPAVPSAPAGGWGNAILTVSRITPKKKILEMLEVFGGLVESGLKGWTFIIAGSVDAERSAYLADIRKRASGLPVRLELNPGFAELSALYGSSKIYWHMTGLDVDQRAEPYEMEHFGITPVEAMARGLVPVLFNGGGLKEIVEDGVNGFLVDGREELAARTAELCASPERLGVLSGNALARSAFFSPAAFKAGLDAVIGGAGGA